MVYFSYFGNRDLVSVPENLLVSVSLYMAKGLEKFKPASELMVPKSIFKAYKYEKSINLEELFILYISEVLMNLDVFEVYKKYNNKIICCYEKDIMECHRYCIYLWFKSYDLEVSVI